jgi:cephalosporin hydroxylase
MNAERQFQLDCADEIEKMASDSELNAVSSAWMKCAQNKKYPYHFTWLGRPIIQYPQDIIAIQEITWRVRPDLIIETGIAHGGSLIFYSSLLEINAACGGPQGARVLGIDIDIRQHNREAVEAHPMSRRITMLEGSSIASAIIDQVKSIASLHTNILLCLDSNHTHDHVLMELETYASLVTPKSYCIVFDTIIENMPDVMFHDRSWGKGNNPMTAVDSFLISHPEFEIDTTIVNKLLISAAPRGYLRRKAIY